jgi:DNA-binding GntR family transcriptional regulator
MSISANSFDPLWVGVAEPLRRRIVEGEIRPGQLLSENQLASEFGVSRTPVREALRILMDEGLVEMLPGRKIRVAVPDPIDVYEVYDIRWLLESEALRRLKANPQLAQETSDRLEQHCRAGDAALANRDRHGLALANERFHEELVSALNNRRMLAQFRTIYNLIALYRHQTLQSDTWAAAGNADHIELIGLIRNGDLDASLALLRDHLVHAQEVLASRLSGSDTNILERTDS